MGGGWDHPNLPTKKENGELSQSARKETYSKPLLPTLQNGSYLLPQRERASVFFRFVSLHSAKRSITCLKKLICMELIGENC